MSHGNTEQKLSFNDCDHAISLKDFVCENIRPLVIKVHQLVRKAIFKENVVIHQFRTNNVIDRDA